MKNSDYLFEMKVFKFAKILLLYINNYYSALLKNLLLRFWKTKHNYVYFELSCKFLKNYLKMHSSSNFKLKSKFSLKKKHNPIILLKFGLSTFLSIMVIYIWIKKTRLTQELCKVILNPPPPPKSRHSTT